MNAAIRVGIDFGNTIGTIEDGPAPFAFEMIGHLVHKLGADNVFVVSKAGPNMELRIRAFLEQCQFYETCHFGRSNVIFVRDYADKATVAQALQLTVFLDDRIKVVRALAPLPHMERIFWMHADASEIELIDKPYRRKIAIVNDWQKTMRYFQRIPSLTTQQQPPT